MASFNPPRLTQQWEYCTLSRDSLHGPGMAIVKRAGAGMVGGETGQFDKLLSLLGENYWEAVGITVSPDGSQSLLFKRPIQLPMK